MKFIMMSFAYYLSLQNIIIQFKQKKYKVLVIISYNNFFEWIKTENSSFF